MKLNWAFWINLAILFVIFSIDLYAQNVSAAFNLFIGMYWMCAFHYQVRLLHEKGIEL